MRRLRQSGPPAGRPPPPPPPSRAAREPAARHGVARRAGCRGEVVVARAGSCLGTQEEISAFERSLGSLKGGNPKRYCSGAACRFRGCGAAVEPGWRQRRSARALRWRVRARRGPGASRGPGSAGPESHRSRWAGGGIRRWD